MSTEKTKRISALNSNYCHAATKLTYFNVMLEGSKCGKYGHYD